MSKTKLHEHLAAEKNVVNGVSKIHREAISTFENKTTFFDGQIRVYTPKDDEGEQLADQSEKLRASVIEKLNYLNKGLINLFNHKLTKETTNTQAVADLVFKGETLANDVPATALLSLESNLAYMRDAYKKIPTRDVSESWEFDEQLKVFKGNTRSTDRTEKVKDWKIVVPATDKFPAQVKETVDTNVLGQWHTTPISGRLSTIEKAALLTNIDAMIVAVKKARARANQQEIVKLDLGQVIVNKIIDNIIEHPVVVDQDEITKVGL